MFQYNVMKSEAISVDAENPKDAIQKVLNGEGIPAGATINVQIRPQPKPISNAPTTAAPNS